MRTVLFAAALFAGALLAACSKPIPTERYQLHGEVVRLDSQDRIATIRHRKIEGWMEAMTMQFPVKDPKEFAKLHPEDCIDATVFVQPNAIWIGEIVDPSGAGPCPPAPKKSLDTPIPSRYKFSVAGFLKMSSPASLQPADFSTPSPADVFRTVAHELRQPLSSIESIAYYLSLVLPRADPKFQEHLARIQELVEQSNWILSNGLRVADPIEPSPAAQPIDLEEIVTEVLSARPSAARLDLAGDLPHVRLDPVRARALVEGLLILFRQVATAAHPAILRTGVRPEGGVFLELGSRAPGYCLEAALCPGAALEIESARRIAQSAGGSLECQVNPATGVLLRAILPS